MAYGPEQQSVQNYKTSLMNELVGWKEQLPEQIRVPETFDPEKIPFQALLLQVLYR